MKENYNLKLEKAAAYALRFCEKYPSWKRSCDLDIKDEINDTAFISEEGKFHKKSSQVPFSKEKIQIYKVSSY